MSDGQQAVRAWVYTTLTGDATLTGLLGGSGRVYERHAVPASASTYVMFEIQMPDYVRVVRRGQGKIMTTGEMVVRAVGPAVRQGAVSFTTLESIIQRCEALLDGAAPSTNAYGSVLACQAQNPLPPSTSPIEGGLWVPEVGTVYEVACQ